MADETQKILPLSAEISAQIQSANSVDEITAAFDKARETMHAEAEAKPPEAKPEPQLFSDTFSIGGKQVEISGTDAADVLRQYKAAVQAYELGRAEKPAPQVESKPVKTAEEIQAEKFELESNFRLGKISATEYLEKSGAVDEYFQKKGIDPAAIKEALEERQNSKHTKSWEVSTERFKENFATKTGTAWIGGKRVLDLMGKTIIELNLQDSPSEDSLQKVYDHLTSQGWDLIKLGKEDAAAQAGEQAESRPQQATTRPADSPAPPKKKLGASGLFNTSGAGGSRELGKPVETPKIDPDDSPEMIMEKWKAANLAAGRNPDDALRETYGVSRVQ